MKRIRPKVDREAVRRAVAVAMSETLDALDMEKRPNTKAELVIALYEWAKRSQDAAADAVIQLLTLPLDEEKVLDAARENMWGWDIGDADDSSMLHDAEAVLTAAGMEVLDDEAD